VQKKLIFEFPHPVDYLWGFPPSLAKKWMSGMGVSVIVDFYL
jgi:hypothetical protein